MIIYNLGLGLAMPLHIKTVIVVMYIERADFDID